MRTVPAAGRRWPCESTHEASIADKITEFAGSLSFVYLHVVWFAAWIIFRVEAYPFGLRTMIVSLEAIFL